MKHSERTKYQTMLHVSIEYGLFDPNKNVFVHITYMQKLSKTLHEFEKINYISIKFTIFKRRVEWRKQKEFSNYIISTEFRINVLYTTLQLIPKIYYDRMCLFSIIEK